MRQLCLKLNAGLSYQPINVLLAKQEDAHLCIQQPVILALAKSLIVDWENMQPYLLCVARIRRPIDELWDMFQPDWAVF